MLAVYATCVIKSEHCAQFEQLAAKMVAASQTDKGCLFYQCGKVQGAENTYVFVEQWQTQADLNQHLQQPHFTENFPIIETIVSQAVEIKIIDLPN